MKCVVIGDLIVDEFVYGEPIGISAESPTIVTRQTESLMLAGGAGCVARHCQALGFDTLLLHTGRWRTEYPEGRQQDRDAAGIDAYEWLNSVPAVKKRRFFCGGYKVAQFDVIPDEREPADVDEIVKNIERFKPDVIIVSDNARLGLDAKKRAKIVKACKGKPVLYDAQYSQTKPSYDGLGRKNVTVFMNDKELGVFGGKVGRALDEIGCGAVVHKRGANGAEMISKGWPAMIEVTGENVNVVDTCGAGDAFIAAYAALIDSFSSHAIEFANRWAAASCETRGTMVPDRPGIVASLARYRGDF